MLLMNLEIKEILFYRIVTHVSLFLLPNQVINYNFILRNIEKNSVQKLAEKSWILLRTFAKLVD